MAITAAFYYKMKEVFIDLFWNNICGERFKKFILIKFLKR
jgi:hypothetical protein